MTATWLFIGSSTSAPLGLEAARRDLPRSHKIITCNAGIKLEPIPDFYFAWDYNAGFQFEPHARAAQAAGCHLITLDEPIGALTTHKVDFYDERLRLTPGEPPSRTSYGHFRCSGLVCMEYALRHGASRLIIVGCDGPKSDSPEDYFDGDGGRLYNRRRNPREALLQVVEPRTRELVALYPEVEFICYGQPAYTVPGANNWHVLPIPGQS